MDLIPLPIQTLFAELAQQVETAAAEEATVVATTVKGVRYLRLQRWVGKSRVVEHLGRADDPEVIARANRAASEMASRAARRELVSTLRRVVPAPTSALGDVLDAVAHAGLFRNGAVLIGTAAYQTYSPIIGVRLLTQDADLATADLALAGDDGDMAMVDILRRADKSFAPVPGLDPRSLPSRFRSARGFLVDVVTPVRRRSDPNPMPLTRLQAGAVPLQQIDWLIDGAIDTVALHGAGVPVRVPQPARFAVHKLILAQKRSAADTAKRRKDLAQASALIGALAKTDPPALADALHDARRRGTTGWQRPIEQSLAELGLEA